MGGRVENRTGKPSSGYPKPASKFQGWSKGNFHVGGKKKKKRARYRTKVDNLHGISVEPEKGQNLSPHRRRKKRMKSLDVTIEKKTSKTNSSRK